MNDEKLIWDFLKNSGLNDFGTAGLMGNLYAESGLKAGNLQNTFEKSLGMADDEYTAAVDAGTYSNFVHDGAGYGLAQWTWFTRKEKLLEYARAHGTSIGDCQMQLGFLVGELEQFGLLSPLRASGSVREASDLVLLQYERPADQSEWMKEKRAEYGTQFFQKYAKSESTVVKVTNSPLVSCTRISPNRYSPRKMPIDRITIHCVVGQCTVEALGAVFADPKRYASSNYGVGLDGRIGMYVEESDCSWCSSNRANDERAVTIETASDNFHPYAVTDKAYRGLLDLCTDICKRHGKKKLLWIGDKEKTLAYKPADDEMVLTVHRWFANKSCPGQYLMDRQGEIAAEVTRRLQDEEDEDMTLDKFKELMGEYRSGLQDNDCGQWSEAARKWAVETGLIQGGTPLHTGEPNYMWQDQISREQMVVLLHRFAQMMGKA